MARRLPAQLRRKLRAHVLPTWKAESTSTTESDQLQKGYAATPEDDGPPADAG